MVEAPVLKYPMPKDVPIDKDEFDSILSKLIQSKPIPSKQAKETPKLKKDGQPKRHKIVQKMDK